MIEKMTFLSITGPKADFDRVAETYLRRYEIQFESALTEMQHAPGLVPFSEDNPYENELKKARRMREDYKNLLSEAGKDSAGEEKAHAASKEAALPEMTSREAAERIGRLSEKLDALLSDKKAHQQAVDALTDAYRRIVPFVGLNYDIRRILHFNSIRYSFGRMPVSSYRKLTDYIYDSLDVLLSECTRDREYVYLVYFVPEREKSRVDAVFSSLYFENIFIPDSYSGSPEEEVNRLHADISGHREQIFALDMKIAECIMAEGTAFEAAAERLERYALLFDIRRYTALTKHDQHTFYIVCGWMRERDAAMLQKETVGDKRVSCYVKKDAAELPSRPPTALLHGRFLRPFSLLPELYGLPAYGKTDPTPLAAFCYMLFFGFMFGDLGQGAVLCLFGAFLYRKTGARFWGILAACGLSSMLFGLTFGSFFGFDGVIGPLWFDPRAAMTELPLIGKLNAAFAAAIACGTALTILCMLLHIADARRLQEAGCDALFVRSFSEPFETLLSFFANMLTFVRIGALAAGHAAMMSAVMALANAESGQASLPVVVLGNLLACGLEGLIVGMQVLCFEYRELFSGFYESGGRAFKPYGKD